MRAKRERIPFAMPSISAAAAAAAVRRCVMPTPSESFLRSEEVKRATETCDAPMNHAARNTCNSVFRKPRVWAMLELPHA
jgi:hypothetical protein